MPICFYFIVSYSNHLTCSIYCPFNTGQTILKGRACLLGCLGTFILYYLKEAYRVAELNYLITCADWNKNQVQPTLYRQTVGQKQPFSTLIF